MKDGSKDDVNPYRSPAFVEEEDDEVEVDRVSTPIDDDELDELHRLKALERDCRHLVGVATAFLVSLTALLVAANLAPDRSGGWFHGHFVVVAGIVCATAAVSLLAAGTKLAIATDGSWGCFAAVGLLLPGLNVAIAAIYVCEAIRTLASRGVRFGWLACDYAQVEKRKVVEG